MDETAALLKELTKVSTAVERSAARRLELYVALRERGVPFSMLAKASGTSAQAVSQLLKRSGK